MGGIELVPLIKKNIYNIYTSNLFFLKYILVIHVISTTQSQGSAETL